MMRFSTMGLALVASVSFAAGCSESPEELATANGMEILRRYAFENNGELPNGRSQNGRSQNGRSQNGRSQNGQISNIAAQNSEGQDSVLVGFEWGTLNPIRGNAWKNAVLNARNELGQEVEVRITDVNNSLVPGTELYMVVFEGSNEPVCGYYNSQPIWASVMTSLFDATSGFRIAPDPTMFTFACRYGAIQKCNEYGWPEWETKTETDGSTTKVRNLDDYHDACIPMIRADYCGNGVTHTYDGTSIDIYDHLQSGQQMATSTNGSDGFYHEAYWESDGAHCINKTRWMPSSLTTLAQNRSLANPDWLYIYNNCPRRFATEVRAGFPPDRDCTAPNFQTSNGFGLFNPRTKQTSRMLLGNNSRLERY